MRRVASSAIGRQFSGHKDAHAPVASVHHGASSPARNCRPCCSYPQPLWLTQEPSSNSEAYRPSHAASHLASRCQRLILRATGQGGTIVPASPYAGTEWSVAGLWHRFPCSEPRLLDGRSHFELFAVPGAMLVNACLRYLPDSPLGVGTIQEPWCCRASWASLKAREAVRHTIRYHICVSRKVQHHHG